MKFKTPRYEVKYFREKSWRNISEEGFLSSLLEDYDLITPVLTKIFEGEEIVTSGAIYRIKNNTRTGK